MYRCRRAGDFFFVSIWAPPAKTQVIDFLEQLSCIRISTNNLNFDLSYTHACSCTFAALATVTWCTSVCNLFLMMQSGQYQTVSTSNIEGVGVCVCVYAWVCCYPQHLLQTFECTPVTLAVGTMIVLPLVYKKCRPILKIWCCHGREMHLHRETVGNIRCFFFFPIRKDWLFKAS